MRRKRLPRGVTERLGWYVYLLRDPRLNPAQVFYVGKGKGSRVLAHVNDGLARPERSDKLDRIREIHAAGLAVDHAILRHGIASEEIAYEVEAAAIDLVDGLANEQRGKHRRLGLTTVDVLIEEHAAKKLDPDVPCLLIKIAKKWRRGMSDADLYEATRACWRASKRRVDGAECVFAVADGIVRGVFIDLAWGPCQRNARKDAGRLEFTGRADATRAKWIGRSVEHLFSRGSQNPLKYWRC